MTDHPIGADVIVIGGGTAGAIVAARHVNAGASVTVIEAGPDYGNVGSGKWPAPLLDASTIPTGHDWGFTGTDAGGQQLPFERARVIGGCSTHNGCTQSTGWRGDYDSWARQSPGWSANDITPSFERARTTSRVRMPDDNELQPFHRAFLEASATVGIQRTDDLADLDGAVGVSVSPVNIVNGVRWNTAISYLDPVRTSPNLTILADTLAATIELDGTHATGAHVISHGQTRTLRARHVVVCAGTYGTPALLLRSGIGPAEHLAQIGVPPRHHLPGVGAHLQDQPVVTIEFAASDALHRALANHKQTHGFLPEEQTVAKIASPNLCDAPYDHHLFPWIEPSHGDRWRCVFALGLLRPTSTGSVRLRVADPEQPPLIDHSYLTEEDDIDRMLDTLPLVDDITRSIHMRPILGPQRHGPPRNHRERTAWLKNTHRHYWHPTSTARMGPDSEPYAVVDNTCNIHGLTGISIVDASVFPRVPRATTALPVAMLAEHYCELTLATRRP